MKISIVKNVVFPLLFAVFIFSPGHAIASIETVMFTDKITEAISRGVALPAGVAVGANLTGTLAFDPLGAQGPLCSAGSCTFYFIPFSIGPVIFRVDLSPVAGSEYDGSIVLEQTGNLQSLTFNFGGFGFNGPGDEFVTTQGESLFTDIHSLTSFNPGALRDWSGLIDAGPSGYHIEFASVPEPGTLALLGPPVLISLGFRSWRKKPKAGMLWQPADAKLFAGS